MDNVEHRADISLVDSHESVKICTGLEVSEYGGKQHRGRGA